MPSIAIPVSLRGQLLYSTRIFDPLSLFALNEPGIWLDPSDLTTMFQDRAGSTAVTTPGQSVGLRLDKSKGLVLGSELFPTLDLSSSQWETLGVLSSVTANSFTNSSGAGAGRRYKSGQLLTNGSRYFIDLSFTKSDATTDLQIQAVGGVIAASSTAASGTLRFRPTSDGTLYLRLSGNATVTVTSLSVKELPGNHAVANSDAARGIYGIEPVGGRRNLLLNTTTMATQNVTVTAAAHTLSFTGTGTVTLSGVSTAGPLVGTGANDRVSLTFTPTAGTLTLTVSGSVTLAQLQIGSAFDAYQRVGTTQYDVTEAGKQTLHYVQYDGSDDGYVTPTITPGIDKVQVFAGVRKLSDAAVGIIYESSANAGTNAGSIQLYNALDRGIQGRARGSNDVSMATTDIGAAPLSFVSTLQGDISGDTSSIRINGVVRASSTADQGTGNYLAYPLYIGRRGGTTLPFNGRDYGIITRFGVNLDASTIAATESWLNQKTGAF